MAPQARPQAALSVRSFELEAIDARLGQPLSQARRGVALAAVTLAASLRKAMKL